MPDSKTSKQPGAPSSRSASSSGPRRVYLLVGEDEFLKKDWLLRFRSGIERDRGACDALVYDKEDGAPAPAAIFDELRTAPLFGGFKLVFLAAADEFVRSHAELIASYLKSPAPFASLALSVTSLPSDKALLKALRQTAAIEELAPPRRGDLVRWLIERCRQHGKQIDSAAAALLAERLGEKPGLLDGALRRLAQQIGSRSSIAIADVQTTVSDERERAFYELSAAIARADAPAALAALHSLLLRETPSDVHRSLVPYLANYVAQLKTVSQLAAKRWSTDEIQKAIGRANAYFLVKEASNLPGEEIDRFAEQIARTDYQLKTSAGPELALLETLIISICTGPRRSAGPRRPSA